MPQQRFGCPEEDRGPRQSARCRREEIPMTIPARCDVVVVGGGPAGSTAATLLARSGYDVVLFDREKHPRYRVGESLIPHAWKYADLLGVADKLKAEEFIQKSGGTVVWKGVIRQMAFKDFGHDRPALHVERDRYDQILLEHSRSEGARVFEEVAVISADLRGAGETVDVNYRPVNEPATGKIRCRFVVDASGQNAVLARQLGARVIDESFRFMSVWGYFKNSKYVAQGGAVHPFDDVRTSPPTTFVSSLDTVDDWGWVWHIAQRESTSVGLVLPQEALKDVKGTAALEAYFLKTCHATPYLDHLLEQAHFVAGSLRVIRDYSYRASTVAGPGYFLTGDAAGFVDPIFSVGIVLGMYSGSLAAWAINRSLKDPTTAARNQALFSSQLLGRLELARSLALPRYGIGGDATELASSAFKAHGGMEQELMYVVATLTQRNENVMELIEHLSGQQITCDRYRTLEQIALGV
jgi:flavin-dependent dehydrogenase